MERTSYVPGSWLGVVRSGIAVLLGPGTLPALARAVWDLLADRPAVHEVLHAVTSSSGGSLASIPSFGILDFNGSLRVFLRGDLDLTVVEPDGAVELNGRDVTTWNERRFALPARCTLAIPGAGEAGLPELPLAEGVILLQSLTLGSAGQAAVTAGQPAFTASRPAAVVVDPDGNADIRAPGDAGGGRAGDPVEPSGPAPAASAPVASASAASALAAPGADPASVPELTIVPEHEVSVATVLEVLDDDGDLLEPGAVQADEGAGGPDADPAAGHAGRDAPAAPEPLAAGPGDPDPADAGLAASIPATDLTSSYDHLWERTVMRNIEDAAVREDPGEGEDASAPALRPVQVPVVAVPASSKEPAPALDAASERPAPERPAPEHPAPKSPVQETPDAGKAPDLPVPPAAGVLIDSVPWRTGGDLPKAPAPAPAPLASGTPGTPVGSPPSNVPASVPQPSPAGAAPLQMPGQFQVPAQFQVQDPAQLQGPAGFDGDHDGQTVMRSSLAEKTDVPAAAPAGGNAGGSTAANGGPQVLARVCAQGHPNPPTRTTCAACGSALLQDAVQVARPRLGRMRLSTGELLDLDQSLVIGRQPSVSRVQGGVMPRLVQVASPGGDISRSHVEVRLEGWHVMLYDLKATNGTVLVREGQPPRRLAQNEMAILLDGDIAELGDGISLRFEEIP